MAFSWEELTYPAGTTSVNVNIDYLDKSYIYLYLDNVLTTAYTWASDTVIQLDSALAASTDVLIVRRTDKEFLYIMFAEGAAFIRENIDTQNTQFLHLAQELTEGRSIEGFYGDLSMNGFRITNLGAGVNPGDAVNKGQLDVVDQRVTSLEETWVTATTSYPWYTTTIAETDVLDPPFNFIKAALYINGVCQTPGYSYEVVDNQIMLADPVPAGTHIFARLGEDVGLDPDYATADQLAAAISQAQLEHNALQASIDGKAAKGANSDITSLNGLTTPLSQAQGGTGNTNGDVAGNSATTTKLANARTFQTNLSSTATASFDGTANVTPGVTGTLPIANGGTGATAAPAARTALGSGTVGDNVFVASTAAAARSAMGAAASGSNADITALTTLSGGITGLTTGTAAASGIVGQEVSAVSGAAVSLTSGTLTNIVSISLPAGDWELEHAARVTNAGNVTLLNFGVSATSATLPTDWWDRYNITTTLAAGTSTRQGMSRRVLLSTTTTLYLVLQATFTSTCTADGYIRARRVR